MPTVYTSDETIRAVLRNFVKVEHRLSSQTLFVEEFALHGGIVRADLAALNGVSHGYEIKSDRDTLSRLPEQVRAYNDVFERATLVGAQRHLMSAREIIPKWWGIVRVKHHPVRGVFLERIRESRSNPSPDAEAIAALLWRPEALQLLFSLGLDSGVRSKSMQHLVTRLAQKVPIERLSRYVRETLRARGDWRAAARLRQYDDKSLQPSSSSRYRRTPYGNICQ